MRPGSSAQVAVERQKLVASNGTAGDEFGFSLALDGNLAVVGDQRAEPSGQRNAGKSHLIERRSGGEWVEIAGFFASDPQEADQLGWDTGLSGTTAVVGAVWEDASGKNAGAVYVAQANFLCSTDRLSLSAGDTVDHLINLGESRAGEQYWVLGSVSGKRPGQMLGGTFVPLDFDEYFKLTLTQTSRSPFTGIRGTLVSGGEAVFSLSSPGGLDPAFAGGAGQSTRGVPSR